MSDELKQGTLANITGNTLEQLVVSTLVPKGFTVVKNNDYVLSPASFGNELLVRNVPYQTIYGHKGKSEFLVHSQRFALNMRIECKWQQSAGSVDEKFPYLYLNCVEAMPESQIMIIIDGGGAKTGAITWLKEAARSRKFITDITNSKTVTVLTLAEFVTWAHNAMR